MYVSFCHFSNRGRAQKLPEQQNSHTWNTFSLVMRFSSFIIFLEDVSEGFLRERMHWFLWLMTVWLHKWPFWGGFWRLDTLTSHKSPMFHSRTYISFAQVRAPGMPALLWQSCLRKGEGGHLSADINLPNISAVLCTCSTSLLQPLRNMCDFDSAGKSCKPLWCLIISLFWLEWVAPAGTDSLWRLGSWVSVQSHAVLTTLAPSSVQIEAVERIWGVRYLCGVGCDSVSQALWWRCTFGERRHQQVPLGSPWEACSTVVRNDCWGNSMRQPSVNRPCESQSAII